MDKLKTLLPNSKKTVRQQGDFIMVWDYTPSLTI